MFEGIDDPRSEAQQVLVDQTANQIYTLGLQYADIDFISKLMVVSLALTTQVLHEKDPHTEDELEEDGPCRHAQFIQNLLQFHFASGMVHHQFGPAELAAVIKAAATAMSLGLKADYDTEMNPSQVLVEILADFSPQGWERDKDRLFEMVIGYRDEIQEKSPEFLEEEFDNLPQVLQDKIRQARGEKPMQEPSEQDLEEMFLALQELLGNDEVGEEGQDA